MPILPPSRDTSTSKIPAQPLICDILAREVETQTYVSFEFYPPRTPEQASLLCDALRPTAAFGRQSPMFVDVTWGGGGSTAEGTPQWCAHAISMGFAVCMHLTCTNEQKGAVSDALQRCEEAGIANVMALRGDARPGETWDGEDEGLTCALDLVRHVRARYGKDKMSVLVAGYPEGHPSVINEETGKCTEEAMEGEIKYLKAKIDAGADAIVTQLFFDASLFLSFRERCRKAGIEVPILPGLFPFTTYRGFRRMVSICRTYIPPEMKAKIELLKEDDRALREYGVEVCTAMCHRLRKAGVNHFHFYCLNQSYSTMKVLQNLGIFVEESATSEKTAATAAIRHLTVANSC